MGPCRASLDAGKESVREEERVISGRKGIGNTCFWLLYLSFHFIFKIGLTLHPRLALKS